MTEWSNIFRILEDAMIKKSDAVIPSYMVKDMYADMYWLYSKAKIKACKKVYKDIMKLGQSSFSVTPLIDNRCVVVSLLGGFRNKDIRKLYEYLNEYYLYTDDVNTSGGRVRICLQVDGTCVYVKFDTSVIKEVKDSYRDMVRVWSVYSNVGNALRDSNDINMWGLFYEIAGDSDPFMKSLSCSKS